MTNTRASDYLRRECGLLLHPTSLPGPHGIGELGNEARRFIDFLEAAGQRLWQILPLGPTGYGNSPYAARSAMAGNSWLVSLDQLVEEGLLTQEEMADVPNFPEDRVDYAAVSEFKERMLEQAYRRFQGYPESPLRQEFDGFCKEHHIWLEDYALFMAVRETKQNSLWTEWGTELATRQPEALEAARQGLSGRIGYHRFSQFLFYRQWTAMKRYANQRGIRIVGDIPIFVSMDSADVWSKPHLFQLDDTGQPTVVSGVPPDYFSETGQRWGNPLYRWDAMEEHGYAWWVERFKMNLEQVDMVRIDHFRGFQAYWEIPASEATAVRGRWVKGPGEKLFRMLEEQLGMLPVIAEDLGVITPEVEALRRTLGYPGMKVLHFGFGNDARNPHLPHNYSRRSVTYTGTHDNDTTMGWFHTRGREERERILNYTATDGQQINWDLIRLAYTSVADVAIVPVQDVLGLGGECRMNEPGQAHGNWDWRLRPGALTDEHAERLRSMSATYGRLESSRQ